MSTVMGQFWKFGVIGALSSAVYSAVYLPLTSWVLPHHWALLAVPPAFLVAATFGFFCNDGWSFRGHGSRAALPHRYAKYVLSQGAGMLLNLFFTGLTTNVFGAEPWVALVPSFTLTPLLTFHLQRSWVFAR